MRPYFSQRDHHCGWHVFLLCILEGALFVSSSFLNSFQFSPLRSIHAMLFLGIASCFSCAFTFTFFMKYSLLFSKSPQLWFGVFSSISPMFCLYSHPSFFSSKSCPVIHPLLSFLRIVLSVLLCSICIPPLLWIMFCSILLVLRFYSLQLDGIQCLVYTSLFFLFCFVSWVFIPGSRYQSVPFHSGLLSKKKKKLRL